MARSAALRMVWVAMLLCAASLQGQGDDVRAAMQRGVDAMRAGQLGAAEAGFRQAFIWRLAWPKHGSTWG